MDKDKSVKTLFSVFVVSSIQKNKCVDLVMSRHPLNPISYGFLRFNLLRWVRVVVVVGGGGVSDTVGCMATELSINDI